MKVVISSADHDLYKKAALFVINDLDKQNRHEQMKKFGLIFEHRPSSEEKHSVFQALTVEFTDTEDEEELDFIASVATAIIKNRLGQKIKFVTTMK